MNMPRNHIFLTVVIPCYNESANLGRGVLLEVRDYLSKKDSVRYVRKDEFLPEMEIKFAKDEIDNYQLNSRIKIPFTGLEVYFPKIEEAIAFKE